MSDRMPSKRELIGKRIVDFSPNPFNGGRTGIAHDPVITLDDGSQLHFVVEETEVGEYGIFISRVLKKDS